MVSQRHRRNKIHVLRNEVGEYLEDKQHIRDHIVGFYLNFLGKQYEVMNTDSMVFEKGPKVTQAVGTKLLEPITNAEIKDALWGIAAKKSPRPDGFSSGSYKTAWPIIGDSICMAMKEFFSSGKLLRQINATALVLLPKKENPQTIKEYRPLVCCNILIKIITKILANRMKPMLKMIVNPVQGAFVEGRLLNHNVFALPGTSQ